MTGGAGDIGRAVAARLARESQTVVIFDVNREAGTQVAAELHERGLAVDFQGVDVSEEAAVQAAFEELVALYRQLDVLVNVAGGSIHRHPLDESPWRTGGWSSTPTLHRPSFAAAQRRPHDKARLGHDHQHLVGYRI